MTQEEKSLLLPDLCARLPYHCRVFYEYVDDLDNKTYGYSLTLNTWCIDEFNADKAIVKPYLCPMSSMTEEERKEYEKFSHFSIGLAPILMDWIYSHHLDCCGLIEKGLALEAPKDMYKV